MVEVVKALGLALVVLLLPVSALAEHEADHRYIVTGFVLDGEHDPLSSRDVTVMRDGELIGRGITDREGRYRIQLHLHDQDLGTRLQVASGRQQGVITVAFERGDKTTPRIHELNLVGGQSFEGPLPGHDDTPWLQILIAIVVLSVAAAAFGLGRRKKRAVKADRARNKPGRGRKG